MPTIIESRVRWPHTGIDAPYAFTINGFNELETGRGVAYSAELVHPELGVVGRIANEGRSGPTTFHSYDHTRFGDRQLEQFLQRSLQDGEPMDTGFTGMETVLDEIINESETAQLVAEMRAKNQFLVRAYLSRKAASGGPYRGAPLIWDRIIAHRADREPLAARLTADARGLDEGASWQMFNGEEWVPLTGTSPLTPHQVTDRLRQVDRLAAELDSPDIHNIDVPFVEGLNLFGTPTAGFTLVGDHVGAVESTKWCTCRRRQKVVAFERWNRGSLEESGTVHAATRCRRLVRLD
ncbi:hypothetical protein AB0A63_31300 [Lentzea sp. NPDC042327]|uniref:hypothetical protein n=1 Tax=Lentzea sp. NPDC042327 TaxID=3154801 RepID=UPI0033FCEE38